MRLLQLFEATKYRRSEIYHLYMPNGGEDGVLVGWRGDWPEPHRVEFRGPPYTQWTGDQGSDFERVHDSLEGWHSTVLHTNKVLDILPDHPDYEAIKNAIEAGSAVNETNLTESTMDLTGWFNTRTGQFLHLDRGEDEMYHHFDLAFDNPKAFGGKRVLGNVVDTTDLIAKVARIGWVRTNHFDGVLYLDVTPETAKPAVAWGAKHAKNIVVGIWSPGGNSGIKEINLNNPKKIKAFLNDSLTEAHNPKVRVRYMPNNNAYYAYLGSNRVGQAQLWDNHDEKVGKDERYVWKSAVHPNFERQGVATALYDFMAKDLAEKGLKLVPSPDTQLSDDAYKFWKARDPESVKGHGRFKSEPYQDYMGKEVTVKGRPAVVYRVGWSQTSNAPLFGIRYTDVPEGSANSQSYVGLGSIQ